MAVVQGAMKRGAPEGAWLERMLRKTPRMRVAVALANKMAHGLWAMMTKRQDYGNPAAIAA